MVHLHQGNTSADWNDITILTPNLRCNGCGLHHNIDWIEKLQNRQKTRESLYGLDRTFSNQRRCLIKCSQFFKASHATICVTTQRRAGVCYLPLEWPSCFSLQSTIQTNPQHSFPFLEWTYQLAS